MLFQVLRQVRGREDSAIVYDPAREFVKRFYDPTRGDVILNPLDKRCPYWGPAEDLRSRSEAKALAASLFQPPQDRKGEFFIESPQKIFAFLMAYGPTPDELVQWMSNPDEIDRRLKGTEHAHLIDPRAHQQRAGVLGSLGLVADSLRLLPKKGEGNGTWTATEWAEKRQGWIFITSLPAEREALRPLQSLWIDWLVLRLLNEPTKEQKRVWFVIDELASLQKLPQLHTAITEGRKGRNPVVLGFQGKAQLEYLYGHLAEVMLSQPATSVWLTTKEPNAGEWVSKFIGKVEIERLRETHFDGTRSGHNFTIERQVEPLVLESEISGLPDLHTFMKYQNYVTYFSFPYFDMPEVAKPFELRERTDDKLPYDPKNMRGGKPEAELKQEPEPSAPVPEPNEPAAAQGFQRLLDIPGYDVAALVEKSGKSASHIYARLSLLQLIPSVAEAFTEERITASHASLIARLPQEHQANAYEQCWRKDWQDKEPHLLPSRHLAAWIQANLYLALADAPFDREDSTLNPTAGACVTCPRRSGYNTSLFCDVQGDQCLDAPCYHGKVEAHIDREIAARPDLVQIENGRRSPKEQRPGALQLAHVREIETVLENPDAEPALPCEAAKTALIVYGKRIGTTLTICTDPNCPVHDPEAAAEHADNPVPVMAPASEEETEEEAAEREREYAQRRKEYEEEQQRKEEERQQQFEKAQKQREAEQARTEKVRKARQANFERILENAPPMFTAAQLRVFLNALVNVDPYSFTDDVASYLGGDDENCQQTPEELLTSAVASSADDKLTSFALRLVLTGHTAPPREGEFDYLADAEAVFVPPQPKKNSKPKKVKAPTLVTPSPKKAKKPVAEATPQEATKSA